MGREAVAVFEEEMWEEEVAGQSVDLKYHCRLSKRVEQEVNKISGATHPIQRIRYWMFSWTKSAYYAPALH